MGLAKKAVVLLMIMVAVSCRVSMGAVYKVGDSDGWTNTVQFDYKAWSASKTFHVGDTILFEYNNQFQNVIRVTHKNFNACNSTAAYRTFTTGNDSFTIPRQGHFYFICGLPGHCESGQKVDIRVPRIAPPPSASPSPSTSHVSSQAPSPSPSGGVSPSGSPPQKSASALVLAKGEILLSLVVVAALSVSGFAYNQQSF